MALYFGFLKATFGFIALYIIFRLIGADDMNSRWNTVADICRFIAVVFCGTAVITYMVVNG